MRELTATTQYCTRCGGSGEYSWCAMWGTTCFKCAGHGVLPKTPKGQKKIKPTAELNDAVIGDIVLYQLVLYRVTAIRWSKLSAKEWGQNQWVIGQRLIDVDSADDAKRYKMPRTVYNLQTRYAPQPGMGEGQPEPGADYTDEDAKIWGRVGPFGGIVSSNPSGGK